MKITKKLVGVYENSAGEKLPNVLSSSDDVEGWFSNGHWLLHRDLVSLSKGVEVEAGFDPTTMLKNINHQLDRYHPAQLTIRTKHTCVLQSKECYVNIGADYARVFSKHFHFWLSDKPQEPIVMSTSESKIVEGLLMPVSAPYKLHEDIQTLGKLKPL